MSNRLRRELKVTMSNRLKARENAGGQAAFGFRFASDWLRGWDWLLISSNLVPVPVNVNCQKLFAGLLTPSVSLIIISRENWKQLTCVCFLHSFGSRLRGWRLMKMQGR